MTVSTEDTTPPNSIISRNSISSVQIQIKSKSQFEFVPRDTEESEFLDWWIVGVLHFQWKLSYLKPVEQTMYSGTVPIKKARTLSIPATQKKKELHTPSDRL